MQTNRQDVGSGKGWGERGDTGRTCGKVINKTVIMGKNKSKIMRIA